MASLKTPGNIITGWLNKQWQQYHSTSPEVNTTVQKFQYIRNELGLQFPPTQNNSMHPTIRNLTWYFFLLEAIRNYTWERSCFPPFFLLPPARELVFFQTAVDFIRIQKICRKGVSLLLHIWNFLSCE